MSTREEDMTDRNRELHPKEIELLEAQIRKELAEAERYEIALRTEQDMERDRLIKPGRIRSLYINDVVTSKNADQWIDALLHWGRRDPGADIDVIINSPGGSVTDGLAVYDTIMRLRRRGHRVTTHGMGIAASMGGVLLQAGDERIMDSRAKMLIHEGSVTLMGNYSAGEQEDMVKFSEMLRSDILDILSERSTLTKRQLQSKWKRKDWWLTADEALKYGFVDRVE